MDLLRFFLEFLFRLKTIEFLDFTIRVGGFCLGDFLLNEQTIALFVQLLPRVTDGLNFLNLALLLIFFLLNTEISEFFFDLIIDFHGSFATAETARLIQIVLLFPLVDSFELSGYEAFLYFIDVGELGLRLLVGRVVVLLLGHVHPLPAQRPALVWADLALVSGDSRFDLFAWSPRLFRVLLLSHWFGLARAALGFTFVLRLGLHVVDRFLLQLQFRLGRWLRSPHLGGCLDLLILDLDPSLPLGHSRLLLLDHSLSPSNLLEIAVRELGLLELDFPEFLHVLVFFSLLELPLQLVERHQTVTLGSAEVLVDSVVPGGLAPRVVSILPLGPCGRK